MNTKTLALPNATISYADEGNGEPIVLLHGFCGSHAYWEKVIPELAKNCRVIAPDLRGHGKSSVTESDYSIQDMAEDIKHLLDKLETDKATIFSHSLGGYIVLAFAERYSERLKGFSLVHSTAYPDSEEL
ncbi:alpha/beta fold hydrolase [Ectobacillus panaciterrae]|uniref:alpha/beta fold hydrolase n=1 Tax=Ectobacillus panaciterrae TaxID=363872 RepID=UPI00041CF5D3|nr:alpha/beta hydrolase [Ectobacillus panaciterrae]